MINLSIFFGFCWTRTVIAKHSVDAVAAITTTELRGRCVELCISNEL
jgi:hypothetical protein